MKSPLIPKFDIDCFRDKDEIDQYIQKTICQKIDLINGKLAPEQVDTVYPEIVQSWLRSKSYNLDPFRINRVYVSESEFAAILQKNSFLMQAFQANFAQIASLLDMDYVVFLISPEGVLLRIDIGKNDLRIDQEFGYTPRMMISEKFMGTTTLSLALSLKRPLYFLGSEFYFNSLTHTRGAASPIFDADDSLIGVLTINSMYLSKINSPTLGLAMALATSIQKDFQTAKYGHHLEAAFDSKENAVFVIDEQLQIIRCNQTAGSVFGSPFPKLIGSSLAALFEQPELLQSAVHSQEMFFPPNCRLAKHNDWFLAEMMPLNNQTGANDYYLVTIRRNIQSIPEYQARNPNSAFQKIVGDSAPMQKLLSTVKRLAPLNETVLIQGESGVGKEVYAHAIHQASRADGPFIAINCASLPASLAESEFFGYEGSSFTGAEKQGRPGKFELAHGGTLFLDEIGDMPLDLQPILLRVLEDKKFMRIGGRKYISVDFRLIVASNKDLSSLVKSNLFREDLYYRLAVFTIHIPPLRERGSDVVLLARHFIDEIARKQQIAPPRLGDDTLFRLLEYDWPGNVRQLKNALIYAVSICQNGIITLSDLPETIRSNADKAEKSAAFYAADSSFSRKEMEKISIMQALIQTGYNVSQTSKILNMSRATLYKKIKEYDISRDLQ